MKYSMKIEWSEEDKCYVLFLPEFTKAMQPVSDGNSYGEAALKGQEALESIVEFYQELSRETIRAVCSDRNIVLSRTPRVCTDTNKMINMVELRTLADYLNLNYPIVLHADRRSEPFIQNARR
jgi:antitoxin HicB